MASDTDRKPQFEQGSSLGAELQKQRALREISVREISDSTKISVRFLEAIERDDFDSLPAPVFTRGFLREYAREIGLDPGEIVDRYMTYVESSERKARAEEREMAERIGGGPIRSIREMGVLAPILIVLAIVIVLALVWFGVSRRDADPEQDTVVPAEVALEADTEEVAEVGENPSQPTLATDGLEMTIAATEESWISLSADGESVMEGVLPAGAERRFRADQEFRFDTIGNAGGVTITLNGTELQPFGRSGQVIRNRSLTRESIDQLR